MQEESWRPTRELPGPLLGTDGDVYMRHTPQAGSLRGPENHLERIKEGKCLMGKT